MHLTSAEGYKNTDMLIEKETGIIWASMKDVQGIRC